MLLVGQVAPGLPRVGAFLLPMVFATAVALTPEAAGAQGTVVVPPGEWRTSEFVTVEPGEQAHWLWSGLDEGGVEVEGVGPLPNDDPSPWEGRACLNVTFLVRLRWANIGWFGTVPDDPATVNYSLWVEPADWDCPNIAPLIAWERGHQADLAARDLAVHIVLFAWVGASVTAGVVLAWRRGRGGRQRPPTEP